MLLTSPKPPPAPSPQSFGSGGSICPADFSSLPHSSNHHHNHSILPLPPPPPPPPPLSSPGCCAQERKREEREGRVREAVMGECGRGELCGGYVSARGLPVDPFLCPREGDEPGHVHCCGFADFKYCCGDPVSYYEYDYTYMRALSIGLLLALSVVALTLVAFVVSVCALCFLFHCTKPKAALRHGLALEAGTREGGSINPAPHGPLGSPLFMRSTRNQPRGPPIGITPCKPPSNNNANNNNTSPNNTNPNIHPNPISNIPYTNPNPNHNPSNIQNPNITNTNNTNNPNANI
ncbi:uncharacterized protein LOC116947872 isoform X2 [Petromyzon marinus]